MARRWLARVAPGWLVLFAMAIAGVGYVDAAAPAVRAVVGPPIGAVFQYQLQPSSTGPGTAGGIDVALCASGAGRACRTPRVFDIDLYNASGVVNRPAVSAIHARHGYAICYVDAGTWENWRPDARRVASSLVGRSNGWPGERWLDIRHPSGLLGLMAARVARCAAAGFDAVEFDNVDAYQNNTGFSITGAEQLAYNEALAQLAHRAGLAVGLKNDPDQAVALVRYFDFALEESCVADQFCQELRPFVSAKKAVYDVEYTLAPSAFCPRALAAHVTAIAKALALNAAPWAVCASAR